MYNSVIPLSDMKYFFGCLFNQKKQTTCFNIEYGADF
jgi:hypothetical protein